MTLRTLKIRLIRWVKIGFVIMVLGAVATVGAMQYTARPSFCKSCHNMRPYYESWRKSAHKNVPCTDCHYEPGLLESLEGKLKALSQIAKYFTNTEGTRPWAEVSDFSCMRSGCHDKRLLEGRIKFGRVNFDHRHHLTDLRRGKSLRCTSCHSQVMVGSHMRVTKSVCFQCHFYGSERSKAMNDCRTCHGPPEKQIKVAGHTFRHRDYTDRGIACKNCHQGITHGNGDVKLNRCRTCHNEPGHLKRFKETAFLHDYHVTKHKVECFNCHNEISHKLRPLRLVSSKGCAPCHKQSHGVQSAIYAGRSGKGVPVQPSRMFETRVSCNACHVCKPGDRQAELRAGKLRRCSARESTCVHCHGRGYYGMKGRLKQHIAGRLTSLTNTLGRVRNKLGAATPAIRNRADVTKALALATHNLSHVRRDGSFGMHNPQYVRAMLRRSEAALARVGKIVSLSPPVDRSSAPSKLGCTDVCHVGIESRDIPYRKTRFSHQVHVAQDSLDCSACHSVKTHGKTKMSQLGCASCHHQSKKANCAGCHSGQNSLYRGKLVTGGKPQPDVMAKAVNCRGCHKKIAQRHVLGDIKKTCVSCHEKGYGAVLDSWRSDMRVDLGRAYFWGRIIGHALRLCGSKPEATAVKKALKRLALIQRSGAVHNVKLSRATINRLKASLKGFWQRSACNAILGGAVPVGPAR